MLALSPRPRRRSWLLVGGALALVAALAVLGRPASDQVDPVRVPADDEVLARVERDEARARAAAAAGDVEATAAYVRQALRTARASGDPRPLGRAQAALARWATVDDPPPPLGLLRATVAQALHEFGPARADLDRVLVRAPDDAQARLTRAAVAAVTGDRATAAADCAAVEPTLGALWAAACAAPVAADHGRGPAARDQLRAALTRAGDRHPAASWAWGGLGDLERQLGDDGAAEVAYRRALTIDADDLYVRAALADLLLDRDRPADAALVTAGAVAEHLVVRRAIALARTAPGSAAAQADRAAVRARFGDPLSADDELHLRERALARLALDRDPAGALADAVAGWAVQRELTDARLVLRAARAAGDRAAAAPVLAWLATHGIDDAVSRTDRAALEAR